MGLIQVHVVARIRISTHTTAWRTNEESDVPCDTCSPVSGLDTLKTLGNFELTSIGQIAIKSHLENYLFGPRLAFAKKNIKTYQFIPFAEAQIGGTYLRSEVQQPSTGIKQTASGNAFSWMLGGGADYVFSDHWAVRANLGFLRSHLANAGQSQLRLVIGVAYSFESRSR